ncbi:MAG: cytochrome c3 family protein [Acidobacteria bacterium]|nr:cytochrome c3 family protein [Acidobacteriota bacterium]
MRLRNRVWKIGLLAGWMWPLLLHAQLKNEDCWTCHSDTTLTKKKGDKEISLFAPAEPFQKSVHGSLDCVTCHADIREVPHSDTLQPVECQTCHSEAFEQYRGSVHGRSIAGGSADAARCADCHGKHDILPVKDPGSRVYPLNLPRTCAQCHGDPELMRRHRIKPENAYQLYMDSIHGQILQRSGLLVAAVCSNCHGSHDIRSREEPTSRVNPTNLPDTCGACHAAIAPQFKASVHGALLQVRRGVPSCNDCHTAHSISQATEPGYQLGVIRECGQCHQEYLRSYRDTYHGKVTALGYTTVAKCFNCHTAHQILPASDPRSSVHLSNLVRTCGECHSQANARFVQYYPHPRRTGPKPHPVLRYTYLFMEGLLYSVLTFFGLHTVLWFQRSIRERRAAGTRDEAASEPGSGEDRGTS